MSINCSTKPTDVIETTQSLRLQMINKLTDNGTRIPTDPKEVATLNNLLNSADSAALTTRKLDVEEKAVDQASIASANVAAILKEMGGNPFKREPTEIKGEVISRAPLELPEVVPVPGQMHQGMDTLIYEDFIVEND